MQNTVIMGILVLCTLENVVNLGATNIVVLCTNTTTLLFTRYMGLELNLYIEIIPLIKLIHADIKKKICVNQFNLSNQWSPFVNNQGFASNLLL